MYVIIILLFTENVEIDFHGKDEAAFKGRKTGKLYLTTHRMIFNNKHLNDPLASFSFPFVTLSQVSSSNNSGGDQPPPYAPPTGPWYQAPPPAYDSILQGYYGWAPPFATFPNQPP
ncbi:postacrosomal sheath WW domain-binding protein-like, partial [Diaphorina citri]|uniref:Postacrosomal sheath WW domain-binding protein-like n=1 Tax=Diaphorina citri TaxID=121845 RepID=A0A1S3DPA8_DIACI